MAVYMYTSQAMVGYFLFLRFLWHYQIVQLLYT
jgi:hypothetical protein